MTNPDDPRVSSLQGAGPSGEDLSKVLMVIGDGSEVMDTLGPFYRLKEDYRVVLAGPEKKVYHLVEHELAPGWDITVERPGYHLESEVAFNEVDPDDYVALVLPGGRAPEYLRYDPDLLRITQDFFEKQKPVGSICHGIEILAKADVIKGYQFTTIPKCRFDGEVCGGKYHETNVVVDRNLACARGKKDIAEWMKAFVPMVERESLKKTG